VTRDLRSYSRHLFLQQYRRPCTGAFGPAAPVQDGVPIQAVRDLLGRQSLITTLRYAKLGDTQWDAVRSVLG
jgi:hypothetical protein